MSNDERAVVALLDRAGAGPMVDPPVRAIVDAGRRRVRRRHSIQITTVALAVSVIAVSVVAVSSNDSATPPPPPQVTAGPLDGPTAQQLADGHWLRIPPAPFRRCDPTLVSTGSEVVALQRPFRSAPGSPPCTSHAAIYEPQSDRWTALPAPTAARNDNDQWIAAWGGGQLIVVSAKTGATQTLRPGDSKWLTQDTMPSRGTQSIVWTGRSFVANVVDADVSSDRSIATTFELQGHTWTPIATLPSPRAGFIAGAPLVAYRGYLYTLATINNRHDDPGDRFTAGHVELLRLVNDQWTTVSVGNGVPKTQVTLTPTDAGIFVAGSSCPSLCTLEDAAAALVAPTTGAVSRLAPPTRFVAYPYDTTAGRDAIVLTYPPGSSGQLATHSPPAGSIWIYDPSPDRWLAGPTEGRGAGDIGQPIWTRDGVVTIGDGPRSGGWLLLPGP